MQKLKISELNKVESSNIDLIGREGDKTFIQFKNGSIYEYPNTSKEEYTALVEADSVGKHFFKSYKAKTDFSQLEGIVLVEKEKKIDLIEAVTVQIDTYRKSGLGAEAGALKLLKAALIKNTKNRKPVKQSVVASAYFKNLQKQQEEYLSIGADTQTVALELKVVEPFTPKIPKPLSDEVVKAAVDQYVGDKGFTQKDTGAIMRYMINTLGNQNGKSIAKFVKEKLK